MILILNNFISLSNKVKLMQNSRHCIPQLHRYFRHIFFYFFQKLRHLSEQFERNIEGIQGIVFIEQVQSVLLLDESKDELFLFVVLEEETFVVNSKVYLRICCHINEGSICEYT